ncbi:hypothetical protein AB0B21_32570 [Streptomyces rimosus]|uniref:hypothetical protein n=1 Tax=Streptomyces rimosus TaxID=1927 RepID=UPI001F1B9298|nr:hypothetical protein [Streptomyces rimosus]
MNENDVADMAVVGQTTITVELTEPVRYIRAWASPPRPAFFVFTLPILRRPWRR